MDPRGLRPDPRRGRRTRLLARPDARRFGVRAGPARPAGGADQVRGARRTDPGDRLHRRSRRAHDHHVREPADRTVAGLHPARLHDRSRPLDLDAASRRPGRRRRDLPARTRVRRTVRVRVPPGRQGRERRLVPRLRDRLARRRGPPPVHPGRDVGHHRTQGRRGADRLPRLPRQAHGPVEPGDVRRAARAHDGPRPAQRPGRRGRVRGPRRLQAGERLARPRHRRPAHRAPGRPPPRSDARHRPRGQARRRRVPAAAGRPRPQPCRARRHRRRHDRRGIRRGPRAGGAEGAVRDRGHRALRHREPGDQRVPARCEGSRRPAQQRRHRHVHQQEVGPGRLPACTPTATPTR